MEAVLLEKGFAPEAVALPGAPPGLEELRRKAFATFEELGFPTPKNEDWKYTGLQPILGTSWTRARREPRLTSPLPDGVRVRRLTEAFAEIEPHLARIARFERSAFTSLNTAFLEDGIVLEIRPGAVIDDPIELVFEAPGAARPEVAYPRVLILAGEGSQVAIVERYTGSGRSFTNAVTEIALADGALLDHYKLQQESDAACHVHTIAVRQGRSSRFTSHNIAFGGALARTDLHVVLDAEGAEAALNGLFVGKGAQHIDNHTVIDHAKPHGVSRELYKGIMDGASRGVFHGTIIVRPDAQKTDALQTNKNLLLSREALVNSTPALEIFADDVKCRHGSTTGQLDAAALFYLRTRGIGEDEARALLTYAFAADVADRIRIPAIRRAVERELGVLLGGSPGETVR
jgi:Fe-S cluster assembly protein SufD